MVVDSFALKRKLFTQLVNIYTVAYSRSIFTRGRIFTRECLLLAVNDAPSPQPVVNKMTQREQLHSAQVLRH